MDSQETPSQPPGNDPNGARSGAGNRTRELLRWLAFALVIIVVFAFFSELALMTSSGIAAPDTASNLRVDYSLWPITSFKPVDRAILEDIRRDEGDLSSQPVIAGEFWPEAQSTTLPSLTPKPTYPPTNTLTPTPTETPVPTRTPTTTPSDTPAPPSSTPTPVPPTATHTYTLRPTNTRALTATRRPSITPTRTRTLTPTISPTVTPTATTTGTETSTPTPTATVTPTPTQTPTPTVTPTQTQLPLPPNINIGDPDDHNHPIVCGKSVTIDLGKLTRIQTLIFYEVEQPNDCKGGICLEWVIIELSEFYNRGYTRYFYWGDYNPFNNGDIDPSHLDSSKDPPEIDGEPIPNGELVQDQGIQISIGGRYYRYVRLIAPNPCGDPAQVDAVDYEPRP